MAFEEAKQYVTAEEGSTNLGRYRAVAWSSTSAGRVVRPADGVPIAGVIVTSPAGVVGRAVTVQTAGVVKMSAAASTVAFGDGVAVSTAGQVTALGAGDYRIGTVVQGTSGNVRLLSVQLSPIGTT